VPHAVKAVPWFTHLLLDQLQPFNSALLVIDRIVFDVPAVLANIRNAASEQREIREARGISLRMTAKASGLHWKLCFQTG